MANNQRRIIPPILLAISVMASIPAFMLGYNAETGYLIKSPATIALYVIMAGSIISAALCAFSAKKDSIISYNSKISAPASLVLHILTVICALLATSAIPQAKYSAGATAVLVLKSVFFASALISFLTNPAIWSKSKNKDSLNLISGYATVLLTLCTVALLYFDISVEMNNPQKILIQLSMAAICLSELSKMRMKIYGNGIRLLTFARLTVLILSPAAATAALVAHFAKSKAFSSFYLLTAIIAGAYAIFYVLTLFFSRAEKQESKAPNEITEADISETAENVEE